MCMSKDDRGHGSYRIDLAYATILGLTVIVTAWCGLQHELWGNMLTFELKEANDIHRAYTVSELKDRQATIADVVVFTNYINAKNTGSEQLAEYYRANFSPKLSKSFETWAQAGSLSNPSAPSPFKSEYYSIVNEPTEELLRQSEDTSNRAVEISAIASNYVFFTTIYASVSFLVGIGRVFPSSKTQRIFLIMGGAMFFVTTLILFMVMPITSIHF